MRSPCRRNLAPYYSRCRGPRIKIWLLTEQPYADCASLFPPSSKSRKILTDHLLNRRRTRPDTLDPAEPKPVYSRKAGDRQVEKEAVMKNGPVRAGIIGSQFQADCHATAIGMIEEDMSVVAVASPTASHARAFADRHKVS